MWTALAFVPRRALAYQVLRGGSPPKRDPTLNPKFLVMSLSKKGHQPR